MKLKRAFIFIIIVILLSFLAYYYPNIQSLATGKSISSPTDTNFQKETVFVDRVIDGDTIVVTGPEIGNKTHIRFLGINNPKGINI